MSLTHLKTTISKLGKESLFEILHLIGSELKDLYGCKMVRVNLEDLYEGDAGLPICNRAKSARADH